MKFSNMVGWMNSTVRTPKPAIGKRACGFTHQSESGCIRINVITPNMCVCVWERERGRERKKERASEIARKRASEREIKIECKRERARKHARERRHDVVCADVLLTQ